MGGHRRVVTREVVIGKFKEAGDAPRENAHLRERPVLGQCDTVRKRLRETLELGQECRAKKQALDDVANIVVKAGHFWVALHVDCPQF
jgi:hypothetical protein